MLANQVRLLLHTAAYWLLLTVRDAMPKFQSLAHAEFTTLRLRLIKVVAASRLIETATRVRIAFAASHPRAELFASIARWLQPAGHDVRGEGPLNSPRRANPYAAQ